MPRTLLQTKLHTPRLEHPLVARPDLVQRIQAGIGGAATLIVAPAGYGKTTLAAQWTEQAQQPVAWLALDANDNDLAQFLANVVTAIQTLYPSACTTLRSLLDRAPLPDTERLAVLLSNEIDQLPARFVLVLDDYHVATDHAIQRLLGELLSRPPRRMHLFLISRSQPALALGRLRGSRSLTELGIQDLRFTERETEMLLVQKWHRSRPREAASTLHARSEGWVAGLHLMAISLNDMEVPLRVQAPEESETNQHVAEYLMEQVLQQQSPLVRDFLLKTSTLERMNGALAEAVTGVSRSQASASLPVLARAGLFLNVADAAGEWYTYHSLFRELLQQQLAAVTPPDQIAVLHRRASAWLCGAGDFDAALDHAFAAGDEQLAVQIVVDHGVEWLESERWRTIQRRINLFAGRRAEQHPWILMIKAQILVLQFRWNVLLPLLTRAEEQLADGSCQLAPQQAALLRGYLHVLWAVHWSSQTDAAKAVAAAEQALPVMPDSSYYARGVIQLALTLALQASGAADRAEQMLEAALAQAELSPAGGVAVLRPTMCLMSLSFAQGNVAAAARLGRIFLHRATAAGSPFNQQLAHLAVAAAAYEMNDLECAASHFAQGVQLCHAGQTRASHECLVGLALASHALGRSEGAKTALAQLDDLHADLSSNPLMAESITLQRRLRLVVTDANMETALRRCAPLRTGVWYGWLEIPALTAVRTRLTSSQAPDAQVEVLLNELWAAAVQLHKPALQAALLALKALLLHRRKQRASALETLQQSLLLGEKHGLVRSIADAGPALAPLLTELAAMEPSAYLDQVRAAIIQPPAKAQAVEGRRVVETLPTHLTRREREVLLLLGQYRTDREIAETLVISPLTVRTHIENLSSKLAANGRRAIVNRAREHGLLA